MRIPLLAVPPVIPLIHDDLHMTETQVGLLVGLPLMMFALAAVPGSLLIARTGAVRIAMAGLFVIALASAARAAAFDIWTLYAATIADGLRRRHHAAGVADAGAALAAATASRSAPRYRPTA